METPFITSKTGHINQISIHKYAFTETYKKNIEKRNKFISWLQHQNLFEVTEDFFTLFQPLDEDTNFQYSYIQSAYITSPFSNTTKISAYVGSLLRKNFSDSYNQYLNYNVFEVENLIFYPFKLIKAFEFNVEIFNNGEFIIHFLPVSKIVSCAQLNFEYLQNLKNILTSQTENDIEIGIVSIKNYKHKRYKLIEDYSKILELISDGNFIGTFDYHSISTFSSTIFMNITKNTVKELNKSVLFLRTALQKINLPDFIQFNTNKEFTKVELTPYNNQSNLFVGNNFSCKDHKAAYYKGVFQPVNNKYILPVCVDNVNQANQFEELFCVFNQGGSDIEILNPILLNSNDDSFINIINTLKSKYKKNFFVVVFTNFKLPKDTLTSLRKLRVQYQLYLGAPDKYQMSNFVVKCIEKSGGILSIIRNSFETNTTYFLGIDLGHSVQENKKVSNLAMVLFDNRGIIVKSCVNKNMPKNEALTEAAIEVPLKKIFSFLKENNLPFPKKMIIHRDGKLHKYDIDNILNKISELFDIDCVDIVEVIKSGYPIIAKYDDIKKKYINLQSGEAWLLHHQRYAIIATNVQVEENLGVINPIIIKHRFGNTEFEKLVYQIYWFTKIYTNNLYNSTRLPATTLKANNIVSTSDILHISSNLG